MFLFAALVSAVTFEVKFVCYFVLSHILSNTKIYTGFGTAGDKLNPKAYITSS